jgi:hypothetical protein
MFSFFRWAVSSTQAVKLNWNMWNAGQRYLCVGSVELQRIRIIDLYSAARSARRACDGAPCGQTSIFLIDLTRLFTSTE